MACLTAAEQRQFEEEGYVVVDGVCSIPSVSSTRSSRSTTACWTGSPPNSAQSGAISSTYSDLAFSDRLTRIYAETGQGRPKYFDCLLPQSGVTHETPFWTGPAVFDLLRQRGRYSIAVESLIGPEIYANPVQHVRMKPPERLTPTDPSTGLALLGGYAVAPGQRRGDRGGRRHAR